MSTLAQKAKHALIGIAIAAAVGGLEYAGTIDISGLLGGGDVGALLAAVTALLISFALQELHAAEAAEDQPDGK
ncbi:MAG: hypothetical protein F4Z28_15415 [Gammaproteobacteria bacterium]|nr:hypothetical protein [Gammaproteobacteria bacterium]